MSHLFEILQVVRPQLLLLLHDVIHLLVESEQVLVAD
jgi:hypothetical protein